MNVPTCHLKGNNKKICGVIKIFFLIIIQKITKVKSGLFIGKNKYVEWHN